MSQRNTQPEAKPVLVPGPETWELWDFARTPPAVVTPGIQSLLDTAIPEGTVVLLPTREIFTFPVWLATTDDASVPDLLKLQIERRGLTTRGGEPSPHRWSVIHRTPEATLVLATVLPTRFPDALALTEAPNYFPAATAWPFPPDSIVLWRELGRLSCAVTRGSTLTHAQTLGGADLDADTIAELGCLLISLDAQGVLGSPGAIVVWDPLPAAQLDALSARVQLPARVAPRPTPQLPSLVHPFQPAAVTEARNRRAARQRRRLYAKAAIAIYALLLIAGAVHLTWLQIAHGRLAADVRRSKPTVDLVTSTARRWEALAPAIQTQSYPLEQLFHCAAVLPAEGVRFTLFQQDANGIIIAGEALNAPAAFKFADDLKANQALAGLKWEMGQPKLLPNDSAQFQLEGKKGAGRARIN